MYPPAPPPPPFDFSELRRPAPPPPSAPIGKMLSLNSREWLESLVRECGPHTDAAIGLLAELEQAIDDAAELDEIAEHVPGEIVGVQEPTAVDALKRFNDLVEWGQESEHLDPTDLDDVKAFVERTDAAFVFRSAMYITFAQAGLIKKSDRSTDLVPILKMFIPEGPADAK